MRKEKCFMEDKKCILWGKKRHIYEFAYMFDSLYYEGYISADEDSQYDVCLKKIMYTDIKEHNKKDFLLIICDLNFSEYESILEKDGIQDEIDYVYFEDCFELLDPFNDTIQKNRKVAIWGTGDTEKNLQEACKANNYNIDVKLYIDSNEGKDGSLYRECPVSMFTKIHNVKQYFIIVASIFYYEIKEELDKCGLCEGVDYLPFSAFMSKPSEMLKELVHTKETVNFYCDRPYTWFYYAWFGAYSCCSTWVKYPIGNPAADTPEECWNSTVAKLYRLSVDTRTYCFCKKEACGLIGDLMTQDTVKPSYHEMPESMVLGLDYTCNLHCASCRENTQVVKGKQLEIREKFADEIIRTGWLEKTKELELSGSGEALFSKIDRKILFSNDLCKRKSISLLTNGILLNEDNLNNLKKHFERIALKISID
ncbi:MAG: hypothetical protein NC489_20490, partial [Ruminococcus flavefaciens]|nr:hypothetical protein [Ruminococcus flavefaciens]